MIGYIQGQVLATEAQRVIVLTSQDLGYEVYVPVAHLPGKEVKLFISHVIREDSQTLFGFQTLEEKRLFELLIEVNGVGPKTAFGLIAHLGHAGVIPAITLENSNLLKEAPGIGKKSADQIILSLKDKMTKLTGSIPLGHHKVTPKDTLSSQLMNETLQACQELGYKEQFVLPVMNKLLQDQKFSSSEELLKSLLRELR
jgi:holliday junction DNA helicase RuvA